MKQLLIIDENTNEVINATIPPSNSAVSKSPFAQNVFFTPEGTYGVITEEHVGVGYIYDPATQTFTAPIVEEETETEQPTED